MAPPMSPTPPRRLRFGPFEVDLRTRELRRDGALVPLQDKPFELLVALLERPGDVVLREELQERLWPDRIVEFDTNVNTAVAKLRRALDDGADEAGLVETLPRRGYRLRAEVSPVEPTAGQGEGPGPGGARASRSRFRGAVVAGGLGLLAAGVVLVAGLASRDRAPDGVQTSSPDALNAYLRGRVLLDEAEGSAGVARSVEQFEEAVGYDPDFAVAWAAFADALDRLPGSEERARASAERALELDPTLASARLRLGSIALYHDLDWDRAEREYERALELDPDLSLVHQHRAAWFSTQGRHDEAIAAMERALELDPVSVVLQADTGWYLYVARRYDAAVERCRQALDVDPEHRGAHAYLLRALEAAGRTEEAGAVAEALFRIEEVERPGGAVAAATPSDSIRSWYDHRLERLAFEAGGAHATAGRLALAHLDAHSDPELVLDLLARAVEERTDWVPAFLGVYPALDPLRDRRRFRALAETVNAPPGG